MADTITPGAAPDYVGKTAHDLVLDVPDIVGNPDPRLAIKELADLFDRFRFTLTAEIAIRKTQIEQLEKRVRALGG